MRRQEASSLRVLGPGCEVGVATWTVGLICTTVSSLTARHSLDCRNRSFSLAFPEHWATVLLNWHTIRTCALATLFLALLQDQLHPDLLLEQHPEAVSCFSQEQEQLYALLLGR